MKTMRKKTKKSIKEYLPNVLNEISLKQFSTFGIGGKAKYFFEALTSDDLVLAVKTAEKEKLPFYILGGGSNVLFSDKGFLGLVIHVKNRKANIKNLGKNFKTIECGAGISLAALVSLASKNNLTGLEWAKGIPGTLGGALRGNAGSSDFSIGDSVKELLVFDSIGRNIKILKQEDCQFGYRTSVFKNKKNLIVIEATLKLKKGDPEKIESKALEFWQKKKTTQPLNFPSAGSVFMNPAGASAGRLIEECGLKGRREGGAMISSKHANFIVNIGDAKAREVKKLINLAKASVKKKFGIELREEIEIVEV